LSVLAMGKAKEEEPEILMPQQQNFMIEEKVENLVPMQVSPPKSKEIIVPVGTCQTIINAVCPEWSELALTPRLQCVVENLNNFGMVCGRDAFISAVNAEMAIDSACSKQVQTDCSKLVSGNPYLLMKCFGNAKDAEGKACYDMKALKHHYHHHGHHHCERHHHGHHHEHHDGHHHGHHRGHHGHHEDEDNNNDDDDDDNKDDDDSDDDGDDDDEDDNASDNEIEEEFMRWGRKDYFQEMYRTKHNCRFPEDPESALPVCRPRRGKKMIIGALVSVFSLVNCEKKPIVDTRLDDAKMSM